MLGLAKKDAASPANANPRSVQKRTEIFTTKPMPSLEAKASVNKVLFHRSVSSQTETILNSSIWLHKSQIFTVQFLPKRTEPR